MNEKKVVESNSTTLTLETGFKSPPAYGYLKVVDPIKERQWRVALVCLFCAVFFFGMLVQKIFSF